MRCQLPRLFRAETAVPALQRAGLIQAPGGVSGDSTDERCDGHSPLAVKRQQGHGAVPLTCEGTGRAP